MHVYVSLYIHILAPRSGTVCHGLWVHVYMHLHMYMCMHACMYMFLSVFKYMGPATSASAWRPTCSAATEPKTPLSLESLRHLCHHRSGDFCNSLAANLHLDGRYQAALAWYDQVTYTGVHMPMPICLSRYDY